ncbi:MAG: hypothetical protein ACOWW1_05590 [archaeon]
MKKSNVKRNKKKFATSALACAVIVVCIIAGLAMIDQPQMFSASFDNGFGEKLSLDVTTQTSKPSMWTLAWRVGASPVSTVNTGVSITPSGANVINPQLTYYVKAVSGSNSAKVVEATNKSITLGSVVSNSTGAVSIDSHLTSLGLSTTQDQSVTYYVYCMVTGVGAVSGETLTAEIAETEFTSVTFDYGEIVQTAVSCSHGGVAELDSSYYEYRELDGSSSYYTIGHNYDGDRDWYRAVFEFSSSAFQGASLSSACLNITYHSTPYPIPAVYVRSMENQPSYCYTHMSTTACGELLWADAADGDLLASFTLPAYEYLESSTSIPLNTTALEDMAQEGWVGVGLSTTSQGEPYYVQIRNYNLKLVVEYASWNLSWSNAPLSLISVPVARQLVIAVLLGFALVLVLSTRKSKNKRGVLAAAALLVIIAGMISVDTVSASATPTIVPEKWRAGDQALYFFSFPSPNTRIENNVLIEEPATIQGDLSLTVAAWNITGASPVTIAIDGEEVDTIADEGYFTLNYKLQSGTHSISVYSDLKVYEQTTFFVVPPPAAPLTVPLTEFMEKLEQQRNSIVMHMVLATVAAIPLGVWTKKKTRIFTEWVLPLPAVCMLFGYVFMPELYFLLPFGAAYAFTFWLCREYANRLVVVSLSESAINISRELALYDNRHVLLGFSPRFWRDGFMKKKELEVKDEYLTSVNVDGEHFEGAVITDLDETEDAIKITCTKSLTQLLLEANVVETLNKRVTASEYTNLIYKRTLGSLVSQAISRIEGVTETELEKISSVDAHLLVDSETKEILAQMSKALKNQEFTGKIDEADK